MMLPAPKDRALAFACVLFGAVLIVAAVLLPLHRDLAVGYLAGWYENYRVPSASMEPAVPVGSLVVGRKVTCTSLEACGLVRGDLIMFVVEKEAGETTWFKQLVGLPGDEVMVHTDGSLEVTSSATGVLHRYCQEDGVRSTEREVVLGPSELFVLGINCPRSNDSRAVRFGPVMLGSVRGVAIYRFDGLDLVSLRQSQD
jgi:signal peptidase I